MIFIIWLFAVPIWMFACGMGAYEAGRNARSKGRALVFVFGWLFIGYFGAGGSLVILGVLGNVVAQFGG